MDPLEQAIEELKKELGEDIITTGNTTPRPEKAIIREAFDDFNERNPLAGGGMLVQPSADGSRPGYAMTAREKNIARIAREKIPGQYITPLRRKFDGQKFISVKDPTYSDGRKRVKTPEYEAFLEKAIPLFNSNDVKLIGDKRSVELGLMYEASAEDWQTEYLDLILSIKIVDDLEAAIIHIQKYSSKHTDGIITENSNTANRFMNVVDSAGVFHNCSTRFADGFRYGFGAEVGISTQTLPPRGPVGLEGLVTYKYFLKGDGNIVDDFSSGKAIYTHKDL